LERRQRIEEEEEETSRQKKLTGLGSVRTGMVTTAATAAAGLADVLLVHGVFFIVGITILNTGHLAIRYDLMEHFLKSCGGTQHTQWCVSDHTRGRQEGLGTVLVLLMPQSVMPTLSLLASMCLNTWLRTTDCRHDRTPEQRLKPGLGRDKNGRVTFLGR
jgi:hypothetical protein